MHRIQPGQGVPSMSFIIKDTTGVVLPRRSFLTAGGIGLSGAAVALLAGRDALAAAAEKTANPAGDVAVLNSAIAAELEAVAAYEVGAKSGLLQPAVLKLAGTF